LPVCFPWVPCVEDVIMGYVWRLCVEDVIIGYV